MSWFFLLTGPAVRTASMERARSIHGDPVCRFAAEGEHYLACGGPPSTMHVSTGDNSSGLTLGTGLPVMERSGRYHLGTPAVWETLAREKDRWREWNGHFVLVTRQQRVWEIRTDPIGLRTAYWCERDGETIVASRLDWICRYIGGAEIDTAVFGARWLLFNQLSYDAPVKRVRRLGAGGLLTIGPGGCRSESRYWSPARIDESGDADAIVQRWTALTTPVVPDGMDISLGLSGGLDSRTLLAMMRTVPSFPLRAHSLGPMADPDVSIPAALTAQEGIPHRVIATPPSDTAVDPAALQDYAGAINASEPVSTAAKLLPFRTAEWNRTVLVDGAFGEIARRQYLNRVEIHGKDAFLRRDIGRIRANLGIRRGVFFQRDAAAQMEHGARREIEQMLAAMPAVDEIDWENYLDLWSVRTRLPNYSADEQARLDGVLTNYMPYVQQDLAQSVFTLPLSLRRNARLFRTIIRQQSRTLARYPLVKSGTTYPFFLPKKTMLGYTAVKGALGFRYAEDHLDPFLQRLRPAILDAVHSQSAREFPMYDHRSIRELADAYYAGDRSRRNDLLWWYTFELWRRSIGAV